MQKKIKISVIIPAYNEDKHITDCLLSIKAQTLSPTEVIVIDDGSVDSTPIELSMLKKTYGIQVITQKHQGPAIARNLGARHAKGDILVFVDADMYFDKNYIKNLVRPIATGKNIVTFTKEEYVANPDNVWATCWNLNNYFPRSLHIDPQIPDKTTTFRAILRKEFVKLGGYKSRGYHDDVTVLRGKKVRAVAANGAICYHFNPETLSEVFRSAKWVGKSDKATFLQFLVFSIPNSIRKGILGALSNHIPEYIIFKVIFDLGITIGILERVLTGKHFK